MEKLYVFLICYFITNVAAAGDYYEEFAKQYENEHPEIAHPHKNFLSGKQVLEAWETANRNFKPGYRPVLNEDGVLLDWVPRDSPND